MNNLKKLAAVLMALIMVLAMAAPAMADETETETTTGTATVTIPKELADHTFAAYQILTGTQAATGGALGNVQWGDGIDTAAFLSALQANATTAEKFAGFTPETFTAAAFADAIAAAGDNSPIAKAVAKCAEAAKIGDGTVLTAGATTLIEGYYLIVDTTNVSGANDAANTSLLQVNRDINFMEKTVKPTVDKQVQDEAADRDTDSEDADGWGETADHAINESFQFKLIANLPVDTDYDAYKTYKVVFNDTMSAGITFESIESVTVDDVAITDYVYAVDSENPLKWTLTINNVKAIQDVDLTDGAQIVVIYKAHLNESADIGNEDTNLNTVYLQYSNNPNAGGEGSLGETEKDTVWVFTYEMPNLKTDDKQQPLAGAGFTLKDGNGTVVNLIWGESLTAYRPATAEEAAVDGYSPEIFSREDGYFTIKGLDAGIYTLTETTTPAGYNTCADIPVVITADHAETDTSAATAITMTVNGTKAELNTVINETGRILPETGGMGTTAIYAAGSLLIVGAALVLLLKKRTVA